MKADFIFKFLFSFLFSMFHCQTVFSTLDSAANFTCSIILNSKNYDQKQYFSESFLLDIVNEDSFLQNEQLIVAIGNCNNFETTTTVGSFKIISITGDYAFITIQLDKTGRINYFNIDSAFIPSLIIESWDDILNYAKTMVGDVGILITDQNATLSKTRAFNDTTRKPLGFGSSMYILAEVAQRIIAATNQWEDTYPMVSKYNFPPYNGNGNMQNLEDGTQVSLLQLIQNMVQNNDNTAANQLFYILQRDQIEEQLFLLNDIYANNTLPFLSVSELYKLKYALSDTDRQNYINSDVATRRLILDTFDNISPEQIKYENSKPVNIYEIEWFGSQQTQCQGLFSFLGTGEATLLSALSLNTPYIDVTIPFSFWNYIGYIGGAEPGVITHTYLMHSYQGDWVCFSLSFANENEPVNQWIVGDFINKIVNVIELVLSNSMKLTNKLCLLALIIIIYIL